MTVAALTLLLLLPQVEARRSAAQEASPRAPLVSSSVANDLSPPLRILTGIPAPLNAVREMTRPGRVPRSQAAGASALPSGVDPVLQSTQGSTPMPVPILSFDGLSNADNGAVLGGGAVPPDTTGDVGPNHYVQMVNTVLAVFDKAGRRLVGPVPSSNLWRGFGGPCEQTNDGDGIVLYDHLADHWLVSQFALPNFPAGPFFQCVAISQTPDPTGVYFRYAFLMSTTKLNDYPKFGVWPDAYYMAINQFLGLTGQPAGQGAVAFERDKILVGQPARMVLFEDVFPGQPFVQGLLPSDLDGTPPPVGAPNYFAAFRDDALGFSSDQLQIFEFRANWANPAASTFTGPTSLTTAAFNSNLCNFALILDCLPQPGTTQRVDAISDRLMFRLQYRNFGDHEALVTNHTVDVDGTTHAGIRWYELHRRGGGWSIHQQGSYAPDANHRWMGSIAMDGDGNIALGYSVSSSSVFPSIRYAGRLAEDPLGKLSFVEATLIAGGGSQNGANRWGDYSTMSVDPTDECTFFYTQEYYASSSPAGWRTRIGSFRYPSCGQPKPTPKEEKKRRKLTETQRQQKERTNALGLDDYRTEGNVMEVDLSGAIPRVVIANIDGLEVVRLECDGGCPEIHVGDYLEADGVKENEQLFDAENVTVRHAKVRLR